MQTGMILPEERIRSARAGGYWIDRILLDDLDRNLSRNPDRIAVTGYNSMLKSNARLTTRHLDQFSRRLAAGFLRRGIQPGDVISAQLPNWWQMIVVHLAALRVGAITNPLMPIFRERELGFMLKLAESKLVIVPERFRDCEHAAMVRGLQASLPDLREVIVIGADGLGSFEQIIEEEPGDVDAEFNKRKPGPNDVIQLLYTSGTTGEPKGVMHTTNTLTATIWQHDRLYGLDESLVTLISSPLAHQTGFLVGIVSPLMLNSRVVLQDIWNASEAVDLIQREKVTFTAGSTPFLSDLVEAAKGRPDAMTTLRGFFAGGAPIPRHLVVRAKEEFGFSVCSVWGMSENGPVTLTRPGDPPTKTQETDGSPLPGMEVKIVDEADRGLPTGSEGRLLVRGAGMFVGYLKRPDLYVTDQEGWFDTGDLARMDPDGYIRITGRSKDVIIRGGENIPVVEIENLIYLHPAVAEVAIVAMPDPRLNERGCAFVVLRPGQSLTLPELVKFLLDKKCSKNYLPERLEIVSALPRTPSGKIQKYKLREAAKAFGVE